MKTFLRVLAIVLLANLGFAALYGGWMLISDPSGLKFGWTIDLLENTPFRSFLIPGIVLVIMNGFLSLFIAIMTIIKARKYEWLIILQGCVLTGWLSIEILFDRDLFEPLMHYPSYLTGILLVIIGIVLLKKYRNAY